MQELKASGIKDYSYVYVDEDDRGLVITQTTGSDVNVYRLVKEKKWTFF